jgi:hypothetical protein
MRSRGDGPRIPCEHSFVQLPLSAFCFRCGGQAGRPRNQWRYLSFGAVAFLARRAEGQPGEGA